MNRKNRNQEQDIAHREGLLQRVERITEFPLMVLAFVMIPLLVGPWLWDMNPRVESTFLVLDYFIWALFVVDLIIKLIISPHRGQYVKKHWLEVLVVIVPFFRPLRIFRIFLFGTRAWVGMRRLIALDFLLVYGIGLVIIAATIVTTVEKGPNATITSFADALWWAIVTITTVGYGDEVPVTLAGKAVAFVLMIGGIAFFSGVTANMASFMIRNRSENRMPQTEITPLLEEIRSLREEISQLRTNSNEQTAGFD